MVLEKTKTASKKAFTLIELLVVITIIGILATGAVSVYTSQIQKARDTTRINDVDALKSWIEQYYQDANGYPDKWAAFSWVAIYTPKMPKDPKTGQANWTSSFDYAYNVKNDWNWVLNQEYEVSTAFENAWTTTSKAWGDGGSDANRLEFWIDLTSINTNIAWKQALTSWVWTPANVTANSCVAPGWTSVAAWIACDTAWAWTNVMIIR